MNLKARTNFKVNSRLNNNIKYKQLEYDYYDKKEKKAMNKENFYTWVIIANVIISLSFVFLIFSFSCINYEQINKANVILKEASTKSEDSNVVAEAYYEVEEQAETIKYNLIVEVNNNSNKIINSIKVVDTVSGQSNEITNLEQNNSQKMILIADVKDNYEYNIKIEKVQFKESADEEVDSNEIENNVNNNV